MSKLQEIMRRHAAMSIINSGDEYDVYSSVIRTYDQVPTGTYKICFDPARGFFLKDCEAPQVNERIYSNHQEKVNKICSRFAQSTRNLGVILSGDKGLGKSIAAKLICIQMLQNDVPVIIVNEYIPGIADFLQRITQRVCVLFDEYDKTFDFNGMSDVDPNVEMLTLFDGVDAGNKLFIITCNNIYNLNEFLVNRPGRFHFHINFNYPNDEEIREYMTANVDPQYADQIEEVIKFSHRVNLNYDCLRAIATELNTGDTFKDAIADLNILNIEQSSYELTVQLQDDTVLKEVVQLNLTSTQEEWFEIPHAQIRFTPANAEYDEQTNTYALNPEDAYVYIYSDDEEVTPKSVTLKRHTNSLHYASVNKPRLLTA